MSKKRKKLTGFLLSFTLALVCAIFMMPQAVFGADTQSDAPAFSKHLSDNGDGTYTLSLSVTGESDTSTITNVNKANVILVLDTSSSMYNNAAAGTAADPHVYYSVPTTPGDPNTGGVTATYYRLNNGTYQQVYYRNGQWRLTNSNTGTVFNGPFYSRSRFWAEYHALTDDGGIVDSLLSQNTTLNPDIIEIGIADFGGHGKTDLNFNSTSNTNAAAIKNVISGLVPTQGTNWEEGLIEAHNIYNTLTADEKENETTYVVFLTDGQPTTHHNSYTVNTGNLSGEFNAAKDDARTLVETDGAEFYGVFTWGDQQYLQCVQSIVGYAYTGTGNYNTGDQGKSDHVFNATSTEALIDALKQIADTITNNVGYTDTGIHDGVTSMTHSTVKATASGDVTGLKYYRGGGDYGEVDLDNGVYGTEWTDAPHATVGDDGVINWELGEGFDLEDGVTYTMTFVVWPDQDSLDLVADLNNGVKSYDSLTPDQKSQIKSSGGKYYLKTNTDFPSVTYKTYTQELDENGNPIPGTRVESDLKTSEIDNPDPVQLAEEKLNALKLWEDTMDPSQREDFGDTATLYLKVDGQYYYVDEQGNPMGVTLQESEDWMKSDYIAIAPGLMVASDSPAYPGDNVAGMHYVTWEGVKYAMIEEGHDYVFEEDSSDIHFELTSYHHHPMIMGENSDGTLNVVDVIFNDDGTIKDIKSLTDSLSATNALKGGVNITKKVVDEDGNEIANTDPFTVKVTLKDKDGNSLPEKTAPDGTTKYKIDYRIYYGPNNPKYGTEGTSATLPGGRSGHNYVNADEFEETIYVGDTIRVVNVEDGAVYTVTETAPTGYEYVGTTYEIAYEGKEANREANPDHVVHSNSASYAEVVNKYTFGDLEVSKTVEVINGDEAQAKAKEFEFTFKLYADDTKAKELTGLKYDYTITKADGTTSTGKITEGGTFKLKDGEKILFEKLPEGSYYEITEAEAAGFTPDPDTRVASGTIVKNEKATAAFTNTYNPDPAKAKIPVVKNITPPGTQVPDITGKFTFTVTAGSNNAGVTTPLPNPASITCGADGETVEFSEVTYTKPGIYHYTVTEALTEGATAGGIGLDNESSRDITVVVTDDGKGNMTAVANGGVAISFNNPYTVTELDITIPLEKILQLPEGFTTGPDITGKFTFTLADDPSDDVESPLPTTKSITNPGASGGSMTFGDANTTGKITVDAPGTYKYTITETGTVAGVTNVSATKQNVTVEVVDNHDGTMSYTVIGGDGETAVTQFVNKYEVTPTTASFPVQKVLSVPADVEGPEEWEYTFTSTPATGAPGTTESKKVTNETENATATFGPYTYSKPGEYTYTITESGTVAGVVNDPAATSGKTVTVTVTDNKNGTLSAVANSTTAKPLQFTNSYHEAKLSIPVTKKLDLPEGFEEGSGPDITGEYTFTISGSEGAPMPETKTVTNSGGAMAFGPITFKEPGEYTYTVKESGSVAGVENDPAATTGKTVTVKVTRNENGDLVPEFDGAASFDFINTYEVEPVEASFPVKKNLQVLAGIGPKSWSYTIDVAANGDAPKAETMTGTVTNTKDTETFGPFKFTKPGIYTYTVTETGVIDGVTNDAAAETGKPVTVTVTDNKDGTLSASVDSTTEKPVTFTNTYTYSPTTATIQVHKDLKNNSPEVSLPDITEQYTFTLTAGDNDAGVETPMPEEGGETVLNPAADGGTAAFGTIKFEVAGVYHYVVTESGEVANVTNDPDAATGKPVTVTVVDGQDGTLVPTVDYGDGKGNVTFTNVFEVEPVTASFPVKKIMDVPQGFDGPATWSYTIDVEANGEAPEAETMTGTVTNTNDTATFGPFTYNKPGTYTYTVTETGTVPGVENDEDATAGKTVTVTVTDNKDGTLSVSADSTTDKPLTFTNKYVVEPVEASFPVQKIMSVPDGLTGPEEWSYTINVAAKDGAPAADSMTGTVTNENDTATFGPFEFDTPGTYEYTVTETGTVAGVENDKDATAGKTVTIEVEDNGDGSLTATASSTEASPLSFTNKYDVESVKAKIPVKKTVTGKNAPEITDEFTFTLVGEDNAPMPAEGGDTVKSNGSGVIVWFDEIEYDEPGVYTYKVSESDTGDPVPGIINDTNVWTVTVNVTDNKDGKLVAAVSSTEDSPIEFVNPYHEATISIPVTKILDTQDFTGPESIQGKFKFTLTAADGTPMPETYEYTNPAANGGNISFGTITYKSEGEFTYTVTETNVGDAVPGVTNDPQAQKTVKVIVTRDKETGELTAELDDPEGIIFTNTYTAEPTEASIPVTKILDVPDGFTGPNIQGKYTFTLEAVDGAPLKDKDGNTITTSYTNPDADGGDIEFGAINYTKPGTYNYTVTETGKVPGVTNDAVATRDVTVTVTDNQDGTMTAKVNGNEEPEAITFTNKYEPEPVEKGIPVEKILTPAGITTVDISEKFTFTLEAVDGAPLTDKDGKEIATEIKNPDKTGGTVSFDDILYTKPGDYTYKITESGGADGVTNDATATKEVTVSVTEDLETGKLVAEVKFQDGDETASKVSFTNEYDAKGDVTLEGMKEYKYGNLADKTFEFEVFKADAEGNPVGEAIATGSTGTPSAAVENAAGEIEAAADGEKAADPSKGAITFTSIDYTLEDLKNADGTYDKSKTFTYVVKEKITNDEDVIFDESTKIVKVKVTDNGKGKLETEITEGKDISFVNQKKYVELVINKDLKDYVDNGDQVDIALVFHIVGTDKDGKTVFDTTAGMSYGKDSDNEQSITLTRIPTYADITVTEEFSGNYDPEQAEFKNVELKKVEGKDGVYCYEVSFTNTKGGHTYEGGVVNHYTNGNDGTQYTGSDGKTHQGQE